MKYSPLEKEEIRLVKIDNLDIGADESETYFINSNATLSIKNLMPFEGGLKTRKGLDCSKGAEVDITGFNGGENLKSILTDCQLAFEGEFAKIGYMRAEFDDSQQIYSIFAVFADGHIKNLGQMVFSRLDDTTYYMAESITFWTGKSQRGGIFAFVSLRNKHDYSQTEYRVMEMDESCEFWEQTINFYVPIVYINGRGNDYNRARTLNQASLSTPKVLESLNMLSGRFYAYYSSDGCSYSFRLPYSGLADSAVQCRIYTDTENYIDLMVKEGESISSKAQLGDKEITMRLNRQMGTVTFFCDNVVFAVPQLPQYPENNIRIMAEKKGDDGFSEIVSSKLSAVLDSKTYFSGGLQGNKLFCCEYENPLYFPEPFSNTVGSGDMPVESITACNGRLFVFKQDGIYMVQIKAGAFLNKIALLADKDSYFTDKDTFTVRKISAPPVPLGARTLQSLGKKPIWADKDGNIIRINAALNIEVFKGLRKTISAKFTSEAISSVWGNNYILMENNYLAIIGLEDSKETAFFWEFPDEVCLVGLCSKGDCVSFLCTTNDGRTAYTALLSGNSDIVKTPSGELAVYNIKSEYVSKRFDSDKSLNINRIKVDIDAEGKTELMLIDGKSSKKFRLLEKGLSLTDQRIDIITNLHGMISPAITVSSEGSISLKQIYIYYHCES